MCRFLNSRGLRRVRFSVASVSSALLATVGGVEVLGSPEIIVEDADWSVQANTFGGNDYRSGSGTASWNQSANSYYPGGHDSTAYGHTEGNLGPQGLALEQYGEAHFATSGGQGTGSVGFSVSEPTLLTVDASLSGWTGNGGTANAWFGVYDGSSTVVGSGFSLSGDSEIESTSESGSLGFLAVPGHSYSLEAWAISLAVGTFGSAGASVNAAVGLGSGSGTIDFGQFAIGEGATFTMTSAGQITEDDCLIIRNFGTFALQGDYNVVKNPPEPCSYFENFTTGTVIKSAGTGTSNFYMPTIIHGGTFNASSGAIAMVGTLTIDSGATWTKTGSGTLVINPAQVNSGTNSLLKVNAGTVALLKNMGSSTAASLSIQASGSTAKLNVGTNQHLAGLSVASGAVAKLATNGSMVLNTGTLSIDSGSSVDLDDNDAIIRTTSKSTVEGYVATARHNGAWDTTGGITSTAAKNNSITGLGVMSGSEYTSITGSSTFSGQAVSSGDTLVKYTYNGDANFSGSITFDDYVRTDTGYYGGRTGWSNGDFNYSGSVTYDDYVLLDTAFNGQSGTLGRAVDWVSGEERSPANLDDPAVRMVVQHLEQFGSAYGAAFLAAVPEASSVAVGVMAGASMIAGRRLRRRG